MNSKIKIFSAILCIIFFSSLVAFAVAGVMKEDKKISETENRVLAQFPDLSVKTLVSADFIAEIEDYLSDQFIGRDKIVSAKTLFSRLLGKTEINGVYIGRDNRLFEVPSEIDEEKLNKTIDAINFFAKNSFIENQFFILAPNAAEIYSESLPVFLELSSQRQQISGIYAALSDNFKCIDAVRVLKEEAQNKDFYFYSDHHWTGDAAFTVFEEFMNAADIEFNEKDYKSVNLSNSFFGTLSSSSGLYEKSDSINAILPKNTDGKYYVNNTDTLEKSASVLFPDKLNTKNQYEVYFGGNFGKLEIQTDNLNKKNILIIKDSYANCFIPLLIPHFEKIVIIDPRYFNGDMQFILEDNSFSHLLFLYNLNTFLEDTSLSEALN